MTDLPRGGGTSGHRAGSIEAYVFTIHRQVAGKRIGRWREVGAVTVLHFSHQEGCVNSNIDLCISATIFDRREGHFQRG